MKEESGVARHPGTREAIPRLGNGLRKGTKSDKEVWQRKAELLHEQGCSKNEDSSTLILQTLIIPILKVKNMCLSKSRGLSMKCFGALLHKGGQSQA